MRGVATFLAVVIVTSDQFALAQAVDLAYAERGPRFLVALASNEPVRVDVARTPTLRRRISVDLRGVPLAQALRSVSQQSGVRLAFSSAVLPADRRVEFRADNITVAAALTEILFDAQVDILFSSDGRGVLIRRQPAVETATVVGRVADANTGQALLGAELILEGTRWRTATNAAGQYRLADVPAGSYTLTARRIGYERRSQSVTVGSGPDVTVDFTLKPAALNLDELVVTGTPEATEKRALGNAIAQIKAAEVLELAPATDAIQLINGRAPGVVVQPATGAVGSGARIRIRGASSITLFAGEPLLYVDGIRVDNRSTAGPGSQSASSSLGVASRLSDFSPDAIESIEIIKGPAAAALYGTEATGGVIQIITKRGKAGARPLITASIQQGANWFQDAENRWPTLYGKDATTGQVYEVNLVRTERERGTPMFGTGQLQGYNLSVSGGADKLRYYAAADLDRENGIEPTNTLRRLSGRSNLDIAFSEKVDASVSLGLVTSDLQLPVEVFGGPWPSQDLAVPSTLNTPLRGFALAPPEVWRRASESRGGTNRLTSGLRLQHRPTSWLSQRLTVGLDVVNEDNFTLIRNTASDPYLRLFNLGVGGGGALGTKWARRVQTTNSTVDYGITATARPTSTLTSSTSAGFQYYRSYSAFTSAEGRSFPDFSVKSISAAATTFSSDDFVENTTVGAYVQQQFGWRNRLFLTGALRADDNSAFGQNFNVVSYPKVSASWVVSEEPFWPLSFVGAFKLRAAYGQSGKQPTAFASLRTYTAVGGELGVGLRPGASGNPDLAPERGEEIEVGFEAGLLDGRVGLDFTYYSEKTKDAILGIPNVPSEGFMGTHLVNAGVIQNRGVEALIRGQVLTGRSVGLEIGVNLSRNSNKVLALTGGQEELRVLDDRLKHRIGYPAFGTFARKVVSADVGPNGVATNVLCAGGVDGLGQPVPCAQAPALFVGPSLPKYEGSVSSTLMLFGRVRLYGMVDFKGGHALFDNSELLRCVRGTCREAVFPNEYSAVRLATTQNASGAFDWSIKQVSFAKLRELSASYTLPNSVARILGAGQASVRVAGRNLHTWTGWTGVDPESFQVSNFFTLIRATTPQLAQFVAAVNMTF